MEIYIKKYANMQELEWEKYALKALENTGVAPQLLKCCKETMCIEMEKITLKTLNIWEIFEVGDYKIIEFAKAEYNLKSTLDKNGVAYYDWKSDHLFYDEKNNFLRLIDYSGDESFKEKNKDKDRIDKEYSFISNPNYMTEQNYIDYKNKILRIYG